ncbi:hypothetical protein [Halapricum sp. CBA1109]|nr:hypothetical protein [Halapricum sp. CBA1109]
MSNNTDEDSRPDDHLSDIEDGCGCAEVWEATSERRQAEADD